MNAIEKLIHSEGFDGLLRALEGGNSYRPVAANHELLQRFGRDLEVYVRSIVQEEVKETVTQALKKYQR